MDHNIVKRGSSQLRGELKSKAQLLVETNYGFLNIPAENIKDGIRDLLDHGSFLFEDPFERKGAFRNPIILTLLVQQWFQGRKAEAAGIFSANFNPIPDKLIALIATAVECALLDWESGTNTPHVNDFTADKYSPVYARHMENLRTMQELKPRKFIRLQKSLWDGAWQRAGRAPPNPTVKGDLSILDFSDSEDELPQQQAIAPKDASPWDEAVEPEPKGAAPEGAKPEGVEPEGAELLGHVDAEQGAPQNANT
ncbi:hypothetical protein PUNSTDRAFT_128996 [Punctularia strigosozonata HHB-11173 SS5]|uniref:uncharacterized protein n=1 Tax=Punctularia strigosozonata (strain HHB-11173) TaxID=741275 RepID=UPI0004417A53|nr:uncharacterized protein PUNSTDRAFT_128996 [Punctularia strigosozonata HHB-11173 SS5]EIN13307.1 hypothetical protein PUNSTDRAFT_128996 [Punctularia strigosozonata HHB-11173 SS5]